MYTLSGKRGIFIQLYNIHGLIRGDNLELGRDADTGGQTKYVLEFAKALSNRDDVDKVEIITRLINDKSVSPDYSVPVEKVNNKLSLIRIRCGSGKYIKKEMLWDYLGEFVDNSISYIKSCNRIPDIIHSHYPDAGFVCTELSRFFGIPFIHTSHSLGRVKKQNLINDGMTLEHIDRLFKMSHRISVEENVILYADRIITSTNQEIMDQYGLYTNINREKFKVLPPGIELSKFFPYNEERAWDHDAQQVRLNIRESLWRFFSNMHKPLILTLCRPVKRKNIAGLIKAFGEDKELQKKANLAIFAGIRKDINEMDDNERETLTEMLLLLDKYDLYGKIAIPKKHDVEYEIPELYRIAAETHGVYVNSSLSETFGLTLIEAASSGLPVIATDDGGPRDIIKNLQNGILVDVTEPRNISEAIKKIIDNQTLWSEYSDNGIRLIKNFYSWESHVDKYMSDVKTLISSRVEADTFGIVGTKYLNCRKMIIVDLDGTLLGDNDSLKMLSEIISKAHINTGFGIATGRTINNALQVLKENNFLLPDIIISSVGTEIYYKSREDYIYSTGWDSHLHHAWRRARIVELLAEFDFLEYQEEEAQRKYKVSYYSSGRADDILKVREKLIRNKVKCNMVTSLNKFIDIIPYRASKGRAVRYLSYRWNIPMDSILVAGDSGNDEDMLRGEMLGVVVANYSVELEKLKGKRKIYFANNKYAAGIIEGLGYYKFFGREDNE